MNPHVFCVTYIQWALYLVGYLLSLFFRLIKSSAAVAHPLHRGLMHCVFRDALLHTTVVMCGYLRYCHLPVRFNQSGPFRLISLINEAFLATELLLTGCFLFFVPFSANPRDSCSWKSQEISSFWEILSLAPTIIPRTKSVRSHFWCLMWTLTEAPDPCLHDLTHCTAATHMAVSFGPLSPEYHGYSWKKYSMNKPTHHYLRKCSIAIYLIQIVIKFN